jgi:septation ring formation regulator EzrA
MENTNNENRNELNAIVSVLGDVLVEIKEMRGAFDRSFALVLDKLGKLDNIEQELKGVKEEIKYVKEEVRGLRTDISKMTDHEERIKALETAVFRRGA